VLTIFSLWLLSLAIACNKYDSFVHCKLLRLKAAKKQNLLGLAQKSE